MKILKKSNRCLAVALMFTFSTQSTLAQQNACNLDIQAAIEQASANAAASAYQQLALQDTPNTSTLSCVDAILDYSYDVLISIPNLADLLADAIDRGCQAVQQRVDGLNDQLDFSFDSTQVLGLGAIPTSQIGFGNNNDGNALLPNNNIPFTPGFTPNQISSRQFDSNTPDALRELFK